MPRAVRGPRLTSVVALAVLTWPDFVSSSGIPTGAPLEEIVVTASRLQLIGVSASASQGIVLADQLENRPTLRPGELLEVVPGLVVTQHSGDGKANQYFLRGFNLDHGTDFATTVDGIPVNLPTNAHGQGYSDLNFTIPELVDTIRPGGLANQKAPRIQTTLRTIREERGDHSLEFLGDMPPLEARDWLTRIDGIGKKTASVLLLFSFGQPLMPVDRHVERVAHRLGLIGPKASADDAHDLFLGMLRPDQMYEAHVNLIQHGRVLCHARRPDCAACPVRPRCRFVDPKAP